MSKLLYLNKDAILLLLRCYPKTLLNKVETPLELMVSLDWSEEQWDDFFTITQSSHFDSATE